MAANEQGGISGKTSAAAPAWRACAGLLLAAAVGAACAAPKAPGAKGAETGSAATVQVRFSPTDQDMPNPERGWYSFSENMVSTSPKRVQGIWDEGSRIAFALVNLWEYRNAPIPRDYLEELDRNFDIYRRTGVKVLLRVVYNYEAGSPDAPLQVIMLQLNQLKPLLAKNADVIAYVQAGLVGAWGEWHSSTNDLTQPAAKAAVRDALLAAVPRALYVQFRYPRDVMAWLPKPIDAAQAFTGSPAARTASHNDCFMSSPNDAGTYASAPEDVAIAERAYVRAQTQYTPYGGETCSGFSPTRQSCPDILKEGAEYHLTYLNRNFYTAFHKQWRAEGCYDEVSRRMGYRLQLDGISHAAAVAAGGSVTVDVDLRNVGWSRIFSARPLVVTLRDKETGTVVQGSSRTDMRYLPPQATASTRMPVTVSLPAGTPPGRYAVSLSLPDVWPTTAKDGRFSVRFANADDKAKGQKWDEDSASFMTGTFVTVQPAPQ